MIIRRRGRMIGDLKNGVFKKKVNHTHLLQVMDAYGIDAEFFETLPPKTKIEIQEVMGYHYTTDKETFKEHGVIRDFGHGEQIFLSRKYFTTNNPKYKVSLPPARPNTLFT